MQLVHLSVCLQDHDYLNSRKRGMSKRLTRDLPLVKLLNISITLSPFLGVGTTQFHTSLMDGTEAYWLSLPSDPQGQLVSRALSCSCKVLSCVHSPRKVSLIAFWPLPLHCDWSIHRKHIPMSKTLNFPQVIRTLYSL